MDFGSWIAFVALGILAVPVVLLCFDYYGTHGEQDDVSATTDTDSETRLDDPIVTDETIDSNGGNGTPTTVNAPSKDTIADDDKNNNWRCACEGGFLPPGLLQHFSGAEAVLRMSAGQCYHKKVV